MFGAPTASRTRTPSIWSAWIWYLGLGGLSASVFLISDRPWVQAGAQLPIYGLSAALLARLWWGKPLTAGRSSRRPPALQVSSPSMPSP